MSALRPIGTGPLGVPEEDVTLAVASVMSVLATSAVLGSTISLVCASTSSIVSTSASLTNSPRLAASSISTLISTSAYLGTATPLAASSTIFALATYAALPQFGLGATATSSFVSSPSVSLTTWPNLRGTVNSPVTTTAASLSTGIPLSASSIVNASADSLLPTLAATISLVVSSAYAPGHGILPTIVPDIAIGLSTDNPNLVGGAVALTYSSVLQVFIGTAADGNPSLSNGALLTSSNNQLILLSNNAILTTSIPLTDTTGPSPQFLTSALLSAGAALCNWGTVTSIVRATTSAYLQTVAAGTTPPDRSQRIGITAYKRLKLTGVGSGLTADYTDIKLTATG
jgi:hypothetical protein